MSGQLSGRVALVTGAARGIGLEIARALYDEGAAVTLADIDGLALRAASKSLGGAAFPLRCDVTRESDVRRAVAATASRFGALSILVNNAGICPLTPFGEVSRKEWDRVVAVNLTAAFLTSQEAYPHIQVAGNRGRIVNISSVGGQMGGVLVGVHYTASKAGLIGLTKSLARSLAPSGGTANCVAPATTATEMTAVWGEELQDRVRSQIPLGRLGTPQEIAAAVRFLCTDDAAFITGATLDVNGGLYLR
ncbi:MAG: SDR family NAD(P)-dependent oxidoreductase [Nitrososphaerales archaeon]